MAATLPYRLRTGIARALPWRSSYERILPMADTVPLIIDIEEIMRMIPHRYPLLLIDRVKDIVPDQSAIGIKNVTLNEPHFTGHFPGRPIMPGVLIIEAMAQ